jgi:hypothetical protein
LGGITVYDVCIFRLQGNRGRLFFGVCLSMTCGYSVHLFTEGSCLMKAQQRYIRHFDWRTVMSGLCAWILMVLAFNAYCAGDEWEKVDTIDGITLFRSLGDVQDNLPFKAEAELDIPYRFIVMALVDAEHKPDWAPKLKSTVLHAVVAPNTFEYSEYYETPWPFKDREFLLKGTVTYFKDRIVFNAQNSPHTYLANPNHLRADIENLTVEVMPLSENSTKIVIVFSGDMGGWIPPFVKTIIQKKWPVRFIQALKHHISSHKNLESQLYLTLNKEPVSFTAYR